MSSICDADLQYLKPGKKVVLKTFNGSKHAPVDVELGKNYWLLVNTKGMSGRVSDDNLRVLLKFDQNLKALGLISCDYEENSLWVLISDLKFVCRY